MVCHSSDTFWFHCRLDFRAVDCLWSKHRSHLTVSHFESCKALQHREQNVERDVEVPGCLWFWVPAPHSLLEYPLMENCQGLHLHRKCRRKIMLKQWSNLKIDNRTNKQVAPVSWNCTNANWNPKISCGNWCCVQSNGTTEYREMTLEHCPCLPTKHHPDQHKNISIFLSYHVQKEPRLCNHMFSNSKTLQIREKQNEIDVENTAHAKFGIMRCSWDHAIMRSCTAHINVAK